MASELTRAINTMSFEEQWFLDALIQVFGPNCFLKIGPDAQLDLSAIHANAGRDFDLVFLDGQADKLAQLLPFLDESAYILIHHAAHHRIAAAIDAALAAHPDELIDCGLVGRGAIWDTAHQAHYGGLRLLRYVRRRRLTVWQEGA